MPTTSLRVPKPSGSYADALVALGVGDLIEEVSGLAGTPIKATIRDDGDAYVIDCRPPIDASGWRVSGIPPGYPYLAWKGDNADTPADSIDYAAQRQIEATLRGLNRKAKTAIENTMGEEAPTPPRPDLPVLKIFNSLRAGSDSYNKLHQSLRETKGLADLVLARLEAYGLETPAINSPPDLGRSLGKAVSAIQLFSPVAGKGINRPKPDGTTLGSLPGHAVDWFEEWMKYRAFHIGLLGFRTGKDNEDTKIYVIAPADMPVSSVRSVRNDLIKESMWGSLRLDIEATLKLAELLIKRSEVLVGVQSEVKMRNRTPRDLIRGIHSVYFKSLGTGSAVTNISFLGLPGWFPIDTAQDANDWLEILGEHRACIRTLREDNSDDIPVLRAYRSFISSGQMEDALEFFALYAVHVMGMLTNSREFQFAKRFGVMNLRRLFVSYNSEKTEISGIVQDEGFLNIATAIRRSTVNAQYRKAREGKSPFEIRYGLAQEWKRQVRFKEQFIATLGDFVSSYNAENARHAEMNREVRKAITIQDMDRVIGLIDRHSSELVGMLLLAYGYGRDAYTREDTDENERSGNIEPALDTQTAG